MLMVLVFFCLPIFISPCKILFGFVFLILYNLFKQVRLNVEVPPAVCEDCYKRVVNEFMKQAKVFLVYLSIFIFCYGYYIGRTEGKFLMNPVLHMQIPGFRPGKNVPESILLSYVGKQNVQKATVESILKRTLPHAMSSVCRSQAYISYITRTN